MENRALAPNFAPKIKTFYLFIYLKFQVVVRLISTKTTVN